MKNKIDFQTRILDIIPGTISWSIIILPIIISIYHPFWIAVFVIVFDFQWLIKAVVFGVHLVSGYLKVRRNSAINWLERLKNFKRNPGIYLASLERRYYHLKGHEKKYVEREIMEVKRALKKGFFNWENLYQVVILTTYKEPVDVLQASIESYLKSSYPKDKMIIVVAMEKREGPEIYKKAEILEKAFGNKFKKLLITVHPDILGEMKAKGANSTWASHMLEKYLKKEKIQSEDVIVSTFDADTRTHPEYFACLSYKYMINPNRRHRS